jgi:predicted nuclease of restriction endonuclease-like (RecB) superfamily
MNQDISIHALYAGIAELLQAARNTVVRAVNQTMVYTYYEIGRRIVEDEQNGNERAEYGKQVLKELSARLTKEFGKGFSEDNLGRMKNFYLMYSKQISATPLRKLDTGDDNEFASTPHIPDFRLSWSHYLKLMRIENEQERRFYEIESFQNNWSLKELQRQFDAALYERLALSRDKDGVRQLSEQGHVVEKPLDIIKDPYILEFLGLPELAAYSESGMETAIINSLENFLLELGQGFTFVGRQVRFTFDEKHFKVDLVFFNRVLKCFVLLDLKIGELTHQDLGQMQMYVNYYDRFVKLADENKTVGIVLCRDKSDALVEITLPEDNEQIFASRYQNVLPDKEQLLRLLKQTGE